jgi:hypothetical protein
MAAMQFGRDINHSLSLLGALDHVAIAGTTGTSRLHLHPSPPPSSAFSVPNGLHIILTTLNFSVIIFKNGEHPPRGVSAGSADESRGVVESLPRSLPPQFSYGAFPWASNLLLEQHARYFPDDGSLKGVGLGRYTHSNPPITSLIRCLNSPTALLWPLSILVPLESGLTLTAVPCTAISMDVGSRTLGHSRYVISLPCVSLHC